MDLEVRLQLLHQGVGIGLKFAVDVTDEGYLDGTIANAGSGDGAPFY